MIPAPGIMIWLVKTVIEIFKINIWKMFVKRGWPQWQLCSCRRSLLIVGVSTYRYSTSDTKGYFMLCFKEEFQVEASWEEPFGCAIANCFEVKGMVSMGFRTFRHLQNLHLLGTNSNAIRLRGFLIGQLFKKEISYEFMIGKSNWEGASLDEGGGNSGVEDEKRWKHLLCDNLSP